jgi:hypothetical protein
MGSIVERRSLRGDFFTLHSCHPAVSGTPSTVNQISGLISSTFTLQVLEPSMTGSMISPSSDTWGQLAVGFSHDFYAF